MTYRRVIPRDLFNEANLLKCLGQLYIHLDHGSYPAELIFTEDGTELPFAVVQDPADGSIYVRNVVLRFEGTSYYLFRSLNSRRPYPIYVETLDDQVLPVFTDQGNLSDEFTDWLSSKDTP